MPTAARPLDERLLAAVRDDLAQALARLQSHASGLDTADAAQRMQRDGPLAGHFQLQALPVTSDAWLVAILLGDCLLTTLMKRVDIRRFAWQ